MRADYIIVGCGLAGLAFAQTLRRKEKSFVVVDSVSSKASLVASGLYNPVMLKRFSLAWKADEQIPLAKSFYEQLQSDINRVFDYKLPIRRLIHSAEEQNNWFAALDKPGVGAFLSPELLESETNSYQSPFRLGEVMGTGRIDTASLISGFMELLDREGQLLKGSFDYELLKVEKDGVSYMDIIASRVVFCEGSGMLRNPYFNYLPLRGNKGELLRIKALGLEIDFILKSNMFFIPLGNSEFLVGATYNRNYDTADPTREARAEIEKHIQNTIGKDYIVIDHTSGVRPTVKDRRPLIGTHPRFSSMAVLNGLGSRGVLTAPYAAKILFDHLENKSEIPDEMNISRFDQDSGFTRA